MRIELDDKYIRIIMQENIIFSTYWKERKNTVWYILPAQIVIFDKYSNLSLTLKIPVGSTVEFR